MKYNKNTKSIVLDIVVIPVIQNWQSQHLRFFFYTCSRPITTFEIFIQAHISPGPIFGPIKLFGGQSMGTLVALGMGTCPNINFMLNRPMHLNCVPNVSKNFGLYFNHPIVVQYTLSGINQHLNYLKIPRNKNSFEILEGIQSFI